MIDKLKYECRIAMPEVDRRMASSVGKALPELFVKPEKEDTGRFPAELKLASSYSTNGWDTVTVCRVSDLNRAVASQGTYPLEMDHTVSEGAFTCRLSGKFSPWSVATGGDGANINLKILFESGNFTMNETCYPITSCEAVIQVRLDYFPQPEKIADPGEYDLKLKKEKGEMRPVSVICFESNLPSLVVESVAQTVFSEWLNTEETLNAIDILFATVRLSIYDSKDFEWLIPTYSSYAYTDVGNDPDESKFGVLCMLKDRIPPDIHQMPAVSFEEGNNLCFMLNREVYVEYQLLPSLPQAFEGASASDFRLNETDKISVTATGLDLPPVTYLAVDYHPKLNQMTVNVEENRIVCMVDFDTEISPGILARTFVQTEHGLRLAENSAGEPIMEYYELSEPVIRNDVDVAAWVIVTEIIAEVIAAVVGLAVGKVVESVVQRVVIAVVVALTCAVISVVIHVIIEKVIADGVKNAVPDISPMVQMATKNVKWPFEAETEENAAGFAVKKIGLNGTLYFEGVIV